MGPHIFSLLGPNTDIGPHLAGIPNPHEARSGAYGRVYQVPLKDVPETTSSATVVAVKVLHNYKWHPARALQLGIREAWKWAQLDHPNVTRLLGLADYERLAPGGGSQLCMVSPWAAYGNAETYIQNNEINWPAALALLWDIACGLEYLHQFLPNPIIHGDLKANNILLFRNFSIFNGRIRGCLIDFGLSRIWSEGESVVNASTSTSAFFGNPRWMAWERLNPEGYGISQASLALTTQSDIFEMMRTFLEILTKRLPYHYLSDMQVIMTVMASKNPQRPTEGYLSHHDGIWNLLEMCWAPPPNERLSATDVRVILEHHRLLASLDTSIPYDPGIEAEVNLQTLSKRLRDVLTPKDLDTRFNNRSWISQFDWKSSLANIWSSKDRSALLINAGLLDVVCTARVQEVPVLQFHPDALSDFLPFIPTSRWRSLELCISSSDQIPLVWEACRSPAPNLEELKLWVDDRTARGYPSWPWRNTWSTLSEITRPLFNGATPRLRTLSLYLLPLSWCTIPYGLLEVLDIRYHPGHLRPRRQIWVSLLRAAPNLRQLTVIHSGPHVRQEILQHPDVLAGDAVSLLKLQDLRIGCIPPTGLFHLFYTLEAPLLRALSLHRLHDADYSDSLVLLDHFRFPRLHSLKIYNVGWPEDGMIEVFRQLYRLDTLELWHGDRYLEGLTRRLATLRATELPLLPVLRTLRTHGYMCPVLSEFYFERLRLKAAPDRLVKDHSSRVESCCLILEACLQDGTQLYEEQPDPDIESETKEFVCQQDQNGQNGTAK